MLTVFLLIAFVGVIRRQNGNGYGSALLGLMGLALLSWPPVDWLLGRPLEGRYPVRPFEDSSLQAIVVLSSAVHAPDFERPYPLPDEETQNRCAMAAWLHHRYQNAPVLACGGAGKSGDQPFSVVMRELLNRSGVPESMIWTEERSHSTHENARFGAGILRQHGIMRIALVVDAKSMPRAAACFRKEGITVLPAPCSFRELGSLSEELLPAWGAIRRNEATLHETLGFAWYWLHGWV
jgi:uncharacterized SAM-binding protein YcdF (DUF218 family)